MELSSLQLKRELQLIREDKTLTTSQKVVKKRALWARFESKFKYK